jgi:hypothetical protein
VPDRAVSHRGVGGTLMTGGRPRARGAQAVRWEAQGMAVMRATRAWPGTSRTVGTWPVNGDRPHRRGVLLDAACGPR